MSGRIATISAVITLSVFTAGCDQTKQYASFAQLGSTYAAAVDKLLVAAGMIKVDSTSEKLLADKKLAAPTLAAYREETASDEDRLKQIGRLRTHVQLMARYFSALNDLATSTAPDAASTAAAGAVQSLGKLGLKTSADNVIAPIAKIAVSSIIRGELRKELETRRQVTIRTELTIQEKLIEELAGMVQHDVGEIRQKLENREVIAPLTAAGPIQNPDQWVMNRRMVLYLSTAPDELQNASAAVKKLRETFENLIEGKLTLDRVNSLLTDFSAILSVGETLKKDLGAKS